MTINRYSYAELKARALSPDATQEDLKALAAWFDEYDPRSWNGEVYDVDGRSLKPIYQLADAETEDYTIVGYELI